MWTDKGLTPYNDFTTSLPNSVLDCFALSYIYFTDSPPKICAI